MSRSVALATAVLVVLASGSAGALSHDLDLSRMVLDTGGSPWNGVDPYNALFNNADQNNPIPNQGFFKSLATELGLAFAPKFLAPAETLGHLGFDIGIEWSLTGINPDEQYWAGPCGGQSSTTGSCRVGSYIEDDAKPKPILTTGQVHIRKGLPFSFELGGTATYLLYTEMAAVGIELKWAFNEGFKYIPDLAVRGSGTRVFGSKGLDLTLGGFDISLSKGFGVGDTVSLTPYAGYNFLYMRAASYVLDATPGVSPGTVQLSRSVLPPDYNGTLADWQTAWDGGIDDTEKAAHLSALRRREDRMYFSFNAESIIAHRQFFGLRFKAHILELVAEVVFAEVPDANLDFGWQFSTKLGLDF